MNYNEPIYGTTNQTTSNNTEEATGIPELFQPGKMPRSYQGLPTQSIESLLSVIQPKLEGSIQNYESNIDDYTQQAMDFSRTQSRDFLDDVLQKSLNSLNARNMLDSSITEGALGKATGQVGANLNNQAFQSAMGGAQMKMQMPDLLGSLMSMGQYTSETNPLAPYSLLAGLM